MENDNGANDGADDLNHMIVVEVKDMNINILIFIVVIISIHIN